MTGSDLELSSGFEAHRSYVKILERFRIFDAETSMIEDRNPGFKE